MLLTDFTSEELPLVKAVSGVVGERDRVIDEISQRFPVRSASTFALSIGRSRPPTLVRSTVLQE